MTLRLRTKILAGAVASAPVLITGQPAVAQAVVQALPSPALADLNSALKDLARNPRSVPVLLRAGWASLELNDTEAALGFFRRAEAEAPGNGEVKAGKAVVELRKGDAVTAIRLFGEAESSGVRMTRFASDRGLAHDLVGDNLAAQRFYREALAQGEDADVTRRLAISQAIAGDQRGSEATLLPLLQRSDLAAYRSRAFALAILGKSEEAVSIAETMLPGSLSNRMAPYLRYMPRLTRAQQAAAANLGRFPPADQIGRDSPAIAALSQQAALPTQVAARTPDARLAPTGQPLGTSSSATSAAPRTERSTQRQQPAPQAAAGLQPPPSKPWPSRDSRVAQSSPAPAPAQPAASPPATRAPATQQPVRTAAASSGLAAGQPVAVAGPSMVKVFEAPPQGSQQSAPQSAIAIPPATAPVVVARTGGELPPTGAPSQVTQATPPPSEAPRPTLSISAPASTPTATAATAATLAPQPAPEPVPDQRTLADAFADFSQPATLAPASNAVDITKIDVKREKPPVKEEPKAPEKPKPPANPSRIWVQVATGRDTKALGFDWRRITREAGPLLAKREPYVAKWGQTNRLLTGPYTSDSEAQKAVSELKKKGVDSFTFTSDAGEAVNPLK